MYPVQVLLAASWDWWDVKVSRHPKRWALSLLAVAFILTFLPAVFGGWAFVFYPIGWVFVLPGLFLAEKKYRQAAETKADQIAAGLRIKKLISLGQKEKLK